MRLILICSIPLILETMTDVVRPRWGRGIIGEANLTEIRPRWGHENRMSVKSESDSHQFVFLHSHPPLSPCLSISGEKKAHLSTLFVHKNPSKSPVFGISIATLSPSAQYDLSTSTYFNAIPY